MSAYPKPRLLTGLEITVIIRWEETLISHNKAGLLLQPIIQYQYSREFIFLPVQDTQLEGTQLSWSPLQTSVPLSQWWISRRCWRCSIGKMGITESETRTPPHRGSLTVTTWPCGPVVTSSWCSPASQPTFSSSLPWCPLFCHLIPSFSKNREQWGSLGKWDSSTNSYENHEELSTCRGTCWCLHCSLLWHGQLLKHKTCRTELIKMETSTQKTGAATQQYVC